MAEPCLPYWEHVVKSGESLDEIACQYYGSSADLHLASLYEANYAVIAEYPNQLQQGITLIIPKMRNKKGNAATRTVPSIQKNK